MHDVGVTDVVTVTVSTLCEPVVVADGVVCESTLWLLDSAGLLVDGLEVSLVLSITGSTDDREVPVLDCVPAVVEREVPVVVSAKVLGVRVLSVPAEVGLVDDDPDAGSDEGETLFVDVARVAVASSDEIDVSVGEVLKDLLVLEDAVPTVAGLDVDIEGEAVPDAEVGTDVDEEGETLPDPEAEAEVDREGEAVPDPEVETDVDMEGEALPDPEAEAEVDEEGEALPDPEAEVDVDMEGEALPGPEVESDVDKEGEALPDPEVETDIGKEVDAVLGPEEEIEVDKEGETLPAPEVETDVDMEGEALPDPEAEADVDMEGEALPGPEVETDVDMEGEALPDPEAEAEVDKELEAVPAPEVEPDVDKEGEALPDPGAEAEVDGEPDPEVETDVDKEGEALPDSAEETDVETAPDVPPVEVIIGVDVKLAVVLRPGEDRIEVVPEGSVVDDVEDNEAADVEAADPELSVGSLELLEVADPELRVGSLELLDVADVDCELIAELLDMLEVKVELVLPRSVEGADVLDPEEDIVEAIDVADVVADAALVLDADAETVADAPLVEAVFDPELRLSGVLVALKLVVGEDRVDGDADSDDPELSKVVDNREVVSGLAVLLDEGVDKTAVVGVLGSADDGELVLLDDVRVDERPVPDAEPAVVESEFVLMLEDPVNTVGKDEDEVPAVVVSRVEDVRDEVSGRMVADDDTTELGVRDEALPDADDANESEASVAVVEGDVLLGEVNELVTPEAEGEIDVEVPAEVVDSELGGVLFVLVPRVLNEVDVLVPLADSEVDTERVGSTPFTLVPIVLEEADVPVLVVVAEDEPAIVGSIPLVLVPAVLDALDVLVPLVDRMLEIAELVSLDLDVAEVPVLLEVIVVDARLDAFVDGSAELVVADAKLDVAASDVEVDNDVKVLVPLVESEVEIEPVLAVPGTVLDVLLAEDEGAGLEVLVPVVADCVVVAVRGSTLTVLDARLVESFDVVLVIRIVTVLLPLVDKEVETEMAIESDVDDLVAELSFDELGDGEFVETAKGELVPEVDGLGPPRDVVDSEPMDVGNSDPEDESDDLVVAVFGFSITLDEPVAVVSGATDEVDEPAPVLLGAVEEVCEPVPSPLEVFPVEDALGLVVKDVDFDVDDSTLEPTDIVDVVDAGSRLPVEVRGLVEPLGCKVEVDSDKEVNVLLPLVESEIDVVIVMASTLAVLDSECEVALDEEGGATEVDAVLDKTVDMFDSDVSVALVVLLEDVFALEDEAGSVDGTAEEDKTDSVEREVGSVREPCSLVEVVLEVVEPGAFGETDPVEEGPLDIGDIVSVEDRDV
ncbi:hypothetical protein JX265_004874 [Neoarthrinium moseri]|uniref:Uncharacterized protein n=1 Tax=Neoarthrinium moseri TaxID=1658444 RepID=A0A9P9WQ73_9PEZI|nr:hypothetical protein JX265_004874 [Neoarthrinium moseri]